MLTRFWQWFTYYITASNGQGHGVHSPFVYCFINHVLLDKRHFYAFENIGNTVDTISSLNIEETFVTHPQFTNKKYLELLFKIVHFYQPKKIIEIGETIGISTAYTFAAQPNVQIQIEENYRQYIKKCSSYIPEILIDNIIFENDFKNIHAVDFIVVHQLNSTTIEQLSRIISLQKQALYIFIHQPYYCNQSVKYWLQLKQQILPIISIDLYSVALIYYKKELVQTEHFKVRY